VSNLSFPPRLDKGRVLWPDLRSMRVIGYLPASSLRSSSLSSRIGSWKVTLISPRPAPNSSLMIVSSRRSPFVCNTISDAGSLSWAYRIREESLRSVSGSLKECGENLPLKPQSASWSTALMNISSSSSLLLFLGRGQ